MEKILISACLLGEPVRYDGGHKKMKDQRLENWRAEGRLVVICPELAGGFNVPRLPAERLGNQVFDVTREDVSAAYEQGAQTALALALMHNCRFALLKENSPSCGSRSIYDGSFTNKIIEGEGVTTALLRAHGIDVFSENEIETLDAQRLKIEEEE
jgi:uncharacterized protein YbbK (DUF523 family)